MRIPLIITGILVGAPLLGGILGGLQLSRYLEFPPRTVYVKHAPFSLVAFSCYSVIILSVVVPLLLRVAQGIKSFKHKPIVSLSFPWWGWLGLLIGVAAWILAWTRFAWFSVFQPHTFIPLWLSYILVINAMTYRRKGGCMMLDRPAYFILLFPTSSMFWWFFEYLNRFVQNWHYAGVAFSPWEYFWYATLSFSTVLPAVLGTREWLLTFAWLKNGFIDLPRVKFCRSKRPAGAILVLAGMGLACTGVWPNYMFSLLWISPFLVIISVQCIMGEKNILDGIESGDWSIIVSSAIGALLCGFFWEMWNYYSLAKWEYSVPFVHGYKVFEMPVLGYAGYLPFGLECAVIGEMLGGGDHGI